MNLERYYRKLPIFAQNIACNLAGWKIQRSRFGAGFARQLEICESRANWPEERVVQFRDERLRNFVGHAANTVPYYRRLFAELGLRADDIRTFEDLQKLPILTRREVQSDPASFVSRAVKKNVCVRVHTSGTTGSGLEFPSTGDAVQEQWAVWWRYRKWHGIRQGEWCGLFSGRPLVPLAQKKRPFWRINYPGRQLLFSAYHMNAENMSDYVAELRRRRLRWLHGYPSLLALLAAHLLNTGEKLDYDVETITCAAENLLPQQAEIIRKAFGVRPIQHYGLMEATANVSQCESGNLHVDEDFAAVEFIPVGEGRESRIVGSNLSNYAFPLLRYDCGDLATVSDRRCRCGRPGRIIEDIDGRREDYIVLKNGARVGRLGHVFKNFVNITETQIFQHKPGEITVRVARGKEYTESDERILLESIQQRLGADTVVKIEYVEKLPRSKTGKLRFVISELNEGNITGILEP